MLNARPQLNGNTEADFLAVYDNFSDAIIALNDARRALFTDVLNGRNYQHRSDGWDRLNEDRNAYFETLIALSETLESIRTDIEAAITNAK